MQNSCDIKPKTIVAAETGLLLLSSAAVVMYVFDLLIMLYRVQL